MMARRRAAELIAVLTLGTVAGLAVDGEDPQGGWAVAPPYKLEVASAGPGRAWVAVSACVVTRSFDASECSGPHAPGYVRDAEWGGHLPDPDGCAAAAQNWASAPGLAVGVYRTDGRVRVLTGTDYREAPAEQPACMDALQDAAMERLRAALEE